MEAGIIWLRKQMESRYFRVLLLVSILTGGVLVAEFRIFSYSLLKIIRYLILAESMFLIAWIDQHEKRIPNRILGMLLIIRLLLLLGEWICFPGLGLSLLISSLLGLLAGGGMLLLVHFISKGGIGMGDVKLLGVIGAYVGISGIMPITFLAVLVSAVYSIVLLIRKKIKLKEEIPFAPFVLAGTLLAMALGI